MEPIKHVLWILKLDTIQLIDFTDYNTHNARELDFSWISVAFQCSGVLLRQFLIVVW